MIYYFVGFAIFNFKIIACSPAGKSVVLLIICTPKPCSLTGKYEEKLKRNHCTDCDSEPFRH